MDKSEDLSRKYEISKDEQKNRGLDNWPQLHTHIQMGNSHWHLRISHCPLTQHSFLTPLAIPNNTEQCKIHNSYQEFDMQGIKTVEQDKSIIG